MHIEFKFPGDFVSILTPGGVTFKISERDGGLDVRAGDKIVYNSADLNEHDGQMPDGAEAEELRKGIELLMEGAYEGQVPISELQDLLDEVNARDSLQVVEKISRLEERVAKLQEQVAELR